MANQGQGWHGDSEGHAEAARGQDVRNYDGNQRDEKKNNWIPFLLIPLVAFAVGMGADRAMNNNNNNHAANQTQNGTQYGVQQGVGGSGYTPCVTPGSGQ